MSDPTLQFETAEYAGAAPSCAVCKAPIAGPHYLLGPNPVCSSCRDQLLQHFRPADSAALAMGAAYGLGAAIVGGVAWYAFSVATGLELGIIAIGVGWLVAYGVKTGAGAGGRVQQVMAVGLTYLAIIGTYVPTLAGDGGDLLSAFVAALAFPVLLVTTGDPSAILWFVIVGIALWGAWQRTAGVDLVFTGPFSA